MTFIKLKVHNKYKELNVTDLYNQWVTSGEILIDNYKCSDSQIKRIINTVQRNDSVFKLINNTEVNINDRIQTNVTDVNINDRMNTTPDFDTSIYYDVYTDEDFDPIIPWS